MFCLFVFEKQERDAVYQIRKLNFLPKWNNCSLYWKISVWKMRSIYAPWGSRLHGLAPSRADFNLDRLVGGMAENPKRWRERPGYLSACSLPAVLRVGGHSVLSPKAHGSWAVVFKNTQPSLESSGSNDIQLLLIFGCFSISQPCAYFFLFSLHWLPSVIALSELWISCWYPEWQSHICRKLC